MSKLFADLRYALRFLTRSPGYFAAAAATLSLGIGANAAIFSVVHSVLLRPLPYPAAERIVGVAETDGTGHEMAFCDPNFRDMREQNRTLAGFAEHTSWVASVSGGSEPVRATRAAVSADFFAALGTQPTIGRAFTPEEQAVGGPAAVIVSGGFWKRQRSGEHDLSLLSGLALRFDGGVYRVVGVMPAGFRFRDEADRWTARERLAPEASRSAHNWRAVGRVRDGVCLEAARKDLGSIAARIGREHGDAA